SPPSFPTRRSSDLVPRCVHRPLRQPLLEFGKRLFSGEDLIPVNLALAAVGLFHSAIEYPHRCCPYVTACAVAFNVRNNRIVWDLQLTAGKSNRAAFPGQRNSVIR